MNAMDHTAFINRFWRLDEENRFSSVETRLFLMLIDLFARVGADRSVTWTNNLATGLLGVSLNAFRKACATLEQRRLIVVESVIVKRRRYTTISLAGTDAALVCEPVDDVEPEDVSPTEEVPVTEQTEASCENMEPAPILAVEPDQQAINAIVENEVSPADLPATAPKYRPRRTTSPVRKPNPCRSDHRRPQRTIPLSALTHKAKRHKSKR